jgi:hypothetical protein
MYLGQLYAYHTRRLRVNYVRNLLDVLWWIFSIFCRIDSLNFLNILSNWLVEFSQYFVELTRWIFSIFCRIDSVNFLDSFSNWLDEFSRYLVELTRWIFSIFCRFTLWIFSIFCQTDSLNFLDIFRIDSMNSLDILSNWFGEFSRYLAKLTRWIFTISAEFTRWIFSRA